jgi:fibro-slime domain-containing protein
VPTLPDRETGSSRLPMLVAVCAALLGFGACAKTTANAALGGGGQAGDDASTGGQGGVVVDGGSDTGGTGLIFGGFGGFGGFTVDAAGDADACTADACGAPDVAQQSVCGDGMIGQGEICDDGNKVGGDGCSASCQPEADFACPAPGEKCVSTVKCNDRKVTGNEQCDDGNNTNGDGCSATCMLECGWTCTVGGGCRAAKCGDGKLAGGEQCDDGNNVDGDGCSALCTLEGKPAAFAEGWVCTSPAGSGAMLGCKGPTTCANTVCGNKIKEGSEQCDDGNTATGDGCSPFCRLEPVCPAAGGACTTACGDGLLLPIDKLAGQECDDGNTVSGDGCSSTCKVEPGFKCTDITVNPTTLILPVVYHDFKSYRDTGGHPDFEHYPGNGQAGITLPTLGANGVPVHAPACVQWTTNLCAPGGANPTWDPAVDWFGMWYVDNATYNKTIVSTLTLPQIAGGAFQYSNDAFFPIDGMGWGNTPTLATGLLHNYGFTSATRYWFEYSGAATLSFVGDDDVWVFVNKRLAVDLGGTHQRATGTVTLDAATGHGYVCDYVAPGTAGGACDPVGKTGGHDVDLELVIGSVYEIVVFQAERYTVESHYQLTINGFSGIKSSCVGACGDGVVTAPEQCDLGTVKNTGAYGTCNADCTLAPGCGDAKVQTPPEECDDGVNLTTYDAARKCGPGCKWASYCGDGMIDGMYEQCDQGADNGKGYGFCAIDCKLGPRCGDGIVQADAGEECDLTGSCDANCKKIHVQ